jgi:GNAT superfamily N-acetyltransferase
MILNGIVSVPSLDLQIRGGPVMEAVFRKAILSDSAEMARLSGQLGYPAQPDEVRRRLHKILGYDDHVVYVAEINDVLAGWVHAHGRYLIESAPFVEIGGIVVDSLYRGRNIGKSLMNLCEDWARSKGFAEIRLRSGGQRLGAHKFYSRIGYDNIKTQQVFSKKL